MTREYRNSRKPHHPILGGIYENEGGGVFECEMELPGNDAIMRNVKSDWVFVAHGIGMYEDCKIDWDYSTGGHFDK